MYAEGIGVAQDRQQAAAWFQKAAEQGHAKAQVYLGSMYRTGDGVKRNYQQALAWYRKAADQGQADAQNELGIMYAAGEVVAKNDQQAIEWFNKVLAQLIRPKMPKPKTVLRHRWLLQYYVSP